MFGNTAWFCLRERAPWFLLLLGMVGAPVVLAAGSGHSSLWTSFETFSPHLKAPLASSTVSPRSTKFSAPALHASGFDTVRGASLAPAAVDREAAAGHALYYAFSISNLGNVDDEYALATAGHRWPVTLLRADSAVKISKTDIVPAGRQFQFVIRIDVPGNAPIGASDSARISLLAAQTRLARRVALNSGWSWISFNVMPDNLDVAQLMDSVANLAIMVNGDGDFYIPNQINGIGAFDVLQGYKVYLNAPDSVKFTGDEVLPNTPIPLRQGWNFVSFLPMMPVAAEAALAGVSQQLALAKNDAGGFYIPNLINTLGSMQPGRGYRMMTTRQSIMRATASCPAKK